MTWKELKAKARYLLHRLQADGGTPLPVHQGAPSDARIEGQPHRVPPVDIVESEAELVLFADVPGATREHTEVRFDGTTSLMLLAGVDRTPGDRPVVGERAPGDWYRAFEIPSHLDGSRATCTLANGVLTVRLPRRKDAVPRRIPVRPAR